MKIEKILADAEIAACYLRALLDKNIPMMSAVQLTQSYVSSYQIAEAAKDEPRKPWEDPPT